MAWGILVSWPEIELIPPAVEVQIPNYWTTREVPVITTWCCRWQEHETINQQHSQSRAAILSQSSLRPSLGFHLHPDMHCPQPRCDCTARWWDSLLLQCSAQDKSNGYLMNISGLRARGERGNRGWDGWMASLTQCTWVWANSGR